MHDHPRRREFIAAGVTALAAMPAFAQSAEWKPTKPIRLICGQAPGASTDATARAYADYFSQRFGIPVTVENKPWRRWPAPSRHR